MAVKTKPSQWIYAQRMRIGFFFGILFTRIPHCDGPLDRFWPLHAWGTSTAVRDVWLRRYILHPELKAGE